MRKLFFLIFILGIGVIVAGCSKPETNTEESAIPGPHDDIAKCLTNKGIKMYGVEWCAGCRLQKKWFNVSFQHIDYVNCDENRAVCQELGIPAYPTWIIDGELVQGAKPPGALAELAGC